MSDENFEVNLDAAQADEGVDSVTDYQPSPYRYGSPEWQPYALSLLREDEVVKVGDNVYPKSAGLRRLVEVLLGDIVYMRPSNIQFFPDGEFGRSIVTVEVGIAFTKLGGVSLDMYEVEPRIFGDVSDVWRGNCPEPFVNHAVATATTKAFSRAFKSALCLNIHTAEEMAGNPNWKKGAANEAPLPEKTIDEIVADNVKMTAPQAKFITGIAPQLGIDPEKLAQKLCKTPVDKLLKDQASKVISLIQEYRNAANKESIPDDIRA